MKRHKLLILLMALLLDEAIGEPPNRWHPVVWMGKFITWLRKNAPKQGDKLSFLYGGMITCGGAGLGGLCGILVARLMHKLPSPFDVMAQAWLLKTTFSLRGLNRAAQEVEMALRADNLPEARRLLSWHLVSRDTSQLDSPHIAAAAIQSVAENTSDGIVAPLVWYAAGGIPAALIYRYINTGDSILGYRDAEREWLGKIPARTDDVLNFIPARLTALLFVALRLSAWKIWRHDANQTASPNAGHPMSAMAGALDIESEKIGHYVLNAGARQPTADDLRMTRQLMYGATALLVVLLAILLRRNHD
jgi:adenosylcobinamide-phosphate synthase